MPRKYTKIPKENREKGEYYEYKREQERIDKKWDWFVRNYNKVIEKVKDEMLNSLKYEYYELCNKVVKEWYEKYVPFAYTKRKHSLYQIPFFEGDSERNYFIVGYDSGKMTRWHRVSNEYIFVNSFVHGWHGGADMLGPNPIEGYEEPHPNPRQGEMDIDNFSGTPYWRFPTNPPAGSGIIRWQHWYPTPAYPGNWKEAIANAPATIIEKEWPKVKAELSKRYEKIIIDRLAPYYKKYCDFEDEHVRW